MKEKDLLLINPRNYGHTPFSIIKTYEWLKAVNGVWLYAGPPSPKEPHAELTSGLHSNGYFDVPRLLKYPNVAEILGNQLGRYLSAHGIEKVDWVVSSAYSAITFGHEVAKALRAVFQNTIKDLKDEKKQIWNRLEIPKGANILDVEELITTTGTANEVRRAVENGNPNPVNFLPLIATFVWRPEKIVQNPERRIICLMSREIQNFDPPRCPYCKVGSPAYHPKTHWKELTGQK